MALDMENLKKGDWVRCLYRNPSDREMLVVGRTYSVFLSHTAGLYVANERGGTSNYVKSEQFEQIYDAEENEMDNTENIKVGDWVKLLERNSMLLGLFCVGERYKVVRVHSDGISIQQNDEKLVIQFTSVEKVEDFTKGDEEVVVSSEIKVDDLVKLTQTSVHIPGFFSVGETYKVIAVHSDGISIQQPDGGAVAVVKLYQIKKVYPAPVPPVPDSKHARVEPQEPPSFYPTKPNTEVKEEEVTMAIKVGDFAKVLQIEETSNFKVGETYIVDDVDEARELVCLRTNDSRCFRWFDTGKVKKQVLISLDEDDEEEMVNHPKHYERNDGSMETIKYMEKVFGTRALITYCVINSFKYRDRAPFKGKTVEDNEKCAWYLEKAEELTGKLGTNLEEFPLGAI